MAMDARATSVSSGEHTFRNAFTAIKLNINGLTALAEWKMGENESG